MKSRQCDALANGRVSSFRVLVGNLMEPPIGVESMTFDYESIMAALFSYP